MNNNDWYYSRLICGARLFLLFVFFFFFVLIVSCVKPSPFGSSMSALRLAAAFSIRMSFVLLRVATVGGGGGVFSGRHSSAGVLPGGACGASLRVLAWLAMDDSTVLGSVYEVAECMILSPYDAESSSCWCSIGGFLIMFCEGAIVVNVKSVNGTEALSFPWICVSYLYVYVYPCVSFWSPFPLFKRWGMYFLSTLVFKKLKR